MQNRAHFVLVGFTMRQSRFFVPTRLGLALIAILLMAASPKAALNVIYASDTVETPAIDPIITGQTISPDQLQEWKAKKMRFEECGLCGEAQPFPGELPE